MTRRGPIVALSVLMLVAVMGAACSRGGPASEQPAAEEPSAEQPAQMDTGGGKPVLMLGRSVMWGWFKHWGWDGTPESLPLDREGYSLIYREMQEPPAIADSAISAMDEAPQGSIVFFKFCFIDFPGGEEASSRFEEQKGWIEQVAAKAAEKDQKLILGNALPKTVPEMDPSLIAEHKEFNAWLEDFASQHEGQVWVFDFYGPLTGSNGAIKGEYSSAPDDAHPNDKGYDQLDGDFFKLLDEISG